MFGRVSPLVSCSAFVNWSDCWCQHLFTSLPSNRFLSSPVKPLVLDGWTTKQQIRLAIVFLLLFVIICFGFVVGRYFWIAVHCFTSSIQSLEPFISIDDSWYSCVCFCLFLFVFVCFCLLLILKQERRTWGFRHQPPSSQQCISTAAASALLTFFHLRPRLTNESGSLSSPSKQQ